MGLFGFGKKKTTTDSSNGKVAVPLLARFFEQAMTDPDGRIRVEDLVSAAAAVCGETLIRTVGEFSPDAHAFVPGAAVLSDAVNKRLTGDQSKWEQMPPESLFAVVRQGALSAGYVASDFPDADEVIRVYVAGLSRGDGTEDAQARWGRPALSIPQENHPRIQPLRYAFELREPVRALFKQHEVEPTAQPVVCAAALAIVLGRIRQAIDPNLVLRLALETLNGMAKMAPMTQRHLSELQGPPS